MEAIIPRNADINFGVFAASAPETAATTPQPFFPAPAAAAAAAAAREERISRTPLRGDQSRVDAARRGRGVDADVDAPAAVAVGVAERSILRLRCVLYTGPHTTPLAW